MSDFVLRTLKESEPQKLFEFLASVFTHRQPDYFRQHFESDNCVDDVVVITDKNDQIVATARVFWRQLWINGQVISAGCIGDVATSSAYRQQGLASKLLNTLFQKMQIRGVGLGSLHTRSAAPLYSKFGFRQCMRPFFKFTMSTTACKTATLNASCHGVHSIDKDNLPTVASVYHEFIQHFNGAVVRDAAYWKTWVVRQFYNAEKPVNVFASSCENDSVGAYIAVRLEASGKVNIIEYCCLDSAPVDLFMRLITTAISSFTHETESITVTIPTAVLLYRSEYMQQLQPLLRDVIVRDDDPAQMYQCNDELFSVLCDNAETKHLFFDTDKF